MSIGQRQFSPIFSIFIFGILALTIYGCADKKEEKKIIAKPLKTSSKLKVIFDSDANNELDDQHALAYLLFNGDTFEVDAVTV
ncbi:MAG: hypothetical protein WBM91_08435, partial [Eudoraea sp.]